MTLNPEQQKVLDDVVDGHNVFITGGAGVGKSFLVNHIKDEVQNIAITAMTGCAALLIGGTTLHSHLAIGLAKDTAQKLAFLARKYPGVREHFFFSRYIQMKYGPVSLFAMYLVLRFIVNIIMLSMVASKKMSAGSMSTVVLIENVISFIFTVVIIRLAMNSGGRI